VALVEVHFTGIDFCHHRPELLTMKLSYLKHKVLRGCSRMSFLKSASNLFAFVTLNFFLPSCLLLLRHSCRLSVAAASAARPCERAPFVSPAANFVIIHSCAVASMHGMADVDNDDAVALLGLENAAVATAAAKESSRSVALSRTSQRRHRFEQDLEVCWNWSMSGKKTIIGYCIVWLIGLVPELIRAFRHSANLFSHKLDFLFALV
jgi:hypothetical protein